MLPFIEFLFNNGSSSAMAVAQYINATNYAVGNGVADDTVALRAAESAAFAAKSILLMPSGTTYLFSGTFQPRVTVVGWGATLKQKDTSANAGLSTLLMSSASGVALVGLKVDSQSKRSGIKLDTCNNVDLYGTFSTNLMFGGHQFYSCSNINVQKCKSTNIIYDPSGSAADGFYARTSRNILFRDCRAESFRRIGFVSEGDSTTKSDHIKWQSCWAKDASNCDDSATEYNAAFWAENTNNCTMVDCVGENIASGIGQSSNRVGVFVLGGFQNAACLQVIQRCHTIGNSVSVQDSAISIYGAVPGVTVVVEECLIQKSHVGIYRPASPSFAISISNMRYDQVGTQVLNY